MPIKQYIHQLEQALRHTSTVARNYLGPLSMNLFVLFLTAYIFLGPVQSIDMFNGLVTDGWPAILWFWLSLSLLSLVMFYSTIISLVLADFSDLYPGEKAERMETKDSHYRAMLLLPYMLGISVYIIAWKGFARPEIIANNYGWYYLVGGLLIYSGIYGLRRWLLLTRGYVYLIEKRRKGWRQLSGMDKSIILTTVSILVVVWLATLAMSFAELKPVWVPQYFASSTLLCLYLAGLVMMVSVAWGLFKFEYAKLLLTLSLVILLPLFSIFNSNHQIRLVDQQQRVKPEMTADFAAWLNDRMDSTYTADNPMPIFLVAAEGGGIRSLKWTALVLDELFASQPAMLRQTYALSGVSGGSVGIVFQQASLDKPAAQRKQQLDRATAQDFLSPATFGLLFPNLAQTILPFPIHAWDRSRWLEDAWQVAIHESYDSDVMNRSINDYWNTVPHRLPNVLLNATCIETGQKVLVSNLQIPPAYFGGVIDLGARLQAENGNAARGIPLKTGASLSARFPIVTSAGTVSWAGQSMNVVDGGYHDNTGLETIAQVLNMIIDTTDPATLGKCRIGIIMIKNSATAAVEEVQASSFLVDLHTPLSTLLNNWGSRVPSTISNVHNLTTVMQKLGLQVEYLPFQLDREVYVNKAGDRVTADQGSKVILPLGWYLSAASNQEIARQVDALTRPAAFSPDWEITARQNHTVFERIMDMLPPEK